MSDRLSWRIGQSHPNRKSTSCSLSLLYEFLSGTQLSQAIYYRSKAWVRKCIVQLEWAGKADGKSWESFNDPVLCCRTRRTSPRCTAFRFMWCFFVLAPMIMLQNLEKLVPYLVEIFRWKESNGGSAEVAFGAFGLNCVDILTENSPMLRCLWSNVNSPSCEQAKGVSRPLSWRTSTVWGLRLTGCICNDLRCTSLWTLFQDILNVIWLLE